MLNTKQFPALRDVHQLLPYVENSDRKKDIIVLHHSATHVGSAEIFHQYHVRHNGWRALGYHFVINNGSNMPDGVIQCNLARDFDKDDNFVEEIGAHAKGINSRSIGICVVGNFDTSKPTRKQEIACLALVTFLRQQFDIPITSIIGHNEAAGMGGSMVYKSCPGYNIDMQWVRGIFDDIENRVWALLTYADYMVEYYEKNNIEWIVP